VHTYDFGYTAARNVLVRRRKLERERTARVTVSKWIYHTIY